MPARRLCLEPGVLHRDTWHRGKPGHMFQVDKTWSLFLASELGGGVRHVWLLRDGALSRKIELPGPMPVEAALGAAMAAALDEFSAMADEYGRAARAMALLIGRREKGGSH